MSIQARIFLAIGLFFVGIAVGWRVDSWRNEAKLKSQDDKIIALQQQHERDAATLDAEVAKNLSSDRDNANINEKTVEIDRAKNPTGYAAVVPANGMSAYRKAIAETIATR